MVKSDKAPPPLSILRAILTAGENYERYTGMLVTRDSPLRMLGFYPHAVMSVKRALDIYGGIARTAPPTMAMALAHI